MTANPVTRIVDAHHHLWDLSAVHYPWLMERGVRRFFGDPTPIQQDYQVADFEADIGDLPVVASVHVQVGAAPDDSVAETRWLQQCARRDGKPAAIVAFADLAAPDCERMLDAQQQYANVRGIRQIIGRHASEDQKTGSGALLDDPRWQHNLGRLAQRGLSFDLQLVPPQLPRAIAVLKDCPGLKVALCHAGSPWDQSADGLAFWRSQLAQLAELPNVYCKLSGFGMFDAAWTERSVAPLFEHVLACFGPARSMFGSNFPVDKLYRDYASVYATYFRLSASLTDDERDALFYTTASRFYRLEG